MQRSESTIAAYTLRAEKLIKVQIRKKSQYGNIDTDFIKSWIAEHYTDLIEWVTQTKDSWVPSTRRQYKAALKCYFESNVTEHESIDWNGLFYSSQSKAAVRKIHGKRTSAKKAKHIDPKVWALLEQTLSQSKSTSAQLTLDIIQASRLFGLRPIEWAYADIERSQDTVYCLTVNNAKTTQNRSFGETRTLRLDITLDPQLDIANGLVSAIRIINHFLDVRAEHADDKTYRKEVEAIMVKCRYYLASVNRQLESTGKIKKDCRVTLYSGRHQFAANAKKAGVSPLEIAAMMGHGALDTQTKHYGRRVHGSGGSFHTQADSNDMQLILNKNANNTQMTR